MSRLCSICKGEKEDIEIITLKCSHIFCWSCINKYIKDSLKVKIKCPSVSCKQNIKDIEIRSVLSSDDIGRYEDICLRNVKNAHTCILPECGTTSIYSDINTQFDCSNCTVYNCVACKKAHKGMSCLDLVSRSGEPLSTVCQRELERANLILQEKLAKMRRASIVESDKIILIPNPDVFVCDLCTRDIGKNMGVMLRQCLHKLCRDCLNGHVKNSNSFPIRCPLAPCQGIIEDKECREILPAADRELYENRSITRATSNMAQMDHCRQFNCSYVCELEMGVKSYTCLKCQSVNCTQCNTIHVNQSCTEYLNSKVSSEDDKNIEKLIKAKKLMRCLDCKTIINKTGGCNWISCPQCGIELCWINQTYRWGPQGPGDTSAGCKCGLNGKMCHPSCGGCIADRGRRHARYAHLRFNEHPLFNLFDILRNPMLRFASLEQEGVAVPLRREAAGLTLSPPRVATPTPVRVPPIPRLRNRAAATDAANVRVARTPRAPPE